MSLKHWKKIPNLHGKVPTECLLLEIVSKGVSFWIAINSCLEGGTLKPYVNINSNPQAFDAFICLFFSFIYIIVCWWTLNSINYNLLLFFLPFDCLIFEYGKLLKTSFCVFFDMSPSFSLHLLAFDTKYLKLILYIPALVGEEDLDSSYVYCF